MKPLPKPQSLAERSAALLRQEILDGNFEPGQRLGERRIAEELGVSRGPVREAMKLLRAEGLLKEVTNRGAFVVSLSPDDVRQIFEVRLAVETRAVKLITRAGRQADIDELASLATHLAEAVRSGRDTKLSKADLAFHEALCRLSRVERLHQIFSRHAPLMHALVPISRKLDPTEDHDLIVAAIASGDEHVASSAIEDHLERARDHDVEYLEGLEETV